MIRASARRRKRPGQANTESIRVMANPKMQGLADWINADPTNRNYAAMTDAQVATDMVVTEQLPAGTITAHDIRQNLQMSEVIESWDAEQAALDRLPPSANAAGVRARVQSLDAYLASFGNENVPQDAYAFAKLIVKRTLGGSSTSSGNIDALLDGDTISRADTLGFAGETEAQMTVRVGKARTL